MYLVKTPWWLRRLYPGLEWRMPGRSPGSTNVPHLYLTFDDGPHEQATPFVLDQLAQFGAKASFFCIGKNVVRYPQLFARIQAEGHSIGNHTQHHVNGWKTPEDDYLREIILCQETMPATPLFRPPYGRISRSQIKALRQKPDLPQRIIMWDVLSGDFDLDLSPENCLKNVVDHAGPGSIVVFHDSTKAWEKLQFVLPRVLQHFSEKGFGFAAL
ncbi:MAG: polysaccharide deacetylase family protein [Sphingobacteriia bacterium]|nr:MAG: polysaccharide deacetylase family protein [Sphingobacteriia bacterium]